MPGSVLTYATRRSALALAQSRAFVGRLRDLDGSITTQELEVITSGDRVQDRPLAAIGGKGLFVKEIEDALLERRADFAVHSMKDMPAGMPDGLVIACVPRREDPRDVLVAPRHGILEALPTGARVGTSSLRRAQSLRARRPDLVIVPIRGNVDTRLRKVDQGEFDAIVLARAGLVRLGLEGRSTEVLSLGASLPAPGQGALAIECREDASPTRTLLARLHHAETATCVAAERGVLLALGGDCTTPLGAYAERSGDLLRLRAFVVLPTGAALRQAERMFPWPVDEADAGRIGRSLGDYLSQEMPHP
jgi:hydroxymethylbilane synthase